MKIHSYKAFNSTISGSKKKKNSVHTETTSKYKNLSVSFCFEVVNLDWYIVMNLDILMVCVKSRFHDFHKADILKSKMISFYFILQPCRVSHFLAWLQLYYFIVYCFGCIYYSMWLAVFNYFMRFLYIFFFLEVFTFSKYIAYLRWDENQNCVPCTLPESHLGVPQPEEKHYKSVNEPFSIRLIATILFSKEWDYNDIIWQLINIMPDLQSYIHLSLFFNHYHLIIIVLWFVIITNIIAGFMLIVLIYFLPKTNPSTGT